MPLGSVGFPQSGSGGGNGGFCVALGTAAAMIDTLSHYCSAARLPSRCPPLALAAFGSICTASRRFADANWFGVNAKELKSVVITTSGAPVAGVMGVLIVRNSRVTD